MIYNSVGMTEKDIGAEIYTDKYGPAIPAAMEKIFGKLYIVIVTLRVLKTEISFILINKHL